MGSAPSAAEDIERQARLKTSSVLRDLLEREFPKTVRAIPVAPVTQFPCPTTSTLPVIGIGTTPAREVGG
jgi:hypothetical protein